MKKFERNESLRQKARFMESPQCAGNDHDFKYCKCFAAWVVALTCLEVFPFKTERGKWAQCWMFDRWTHVKGFRNRWWVKG